MSRKRRNKQQTQEQHAQEFVMKVLIEQQINQLRFKHSSQKELFRSIKENPITIGNGPAGTGKTYIALWSALSLLINNPEQYKKIILMKPYVEAGEKLGFLPGGVKQKLDPYLISYYWNLEQIVGKDMLKTLMSDGKMEFFPLGLIRGITFKDCIVILDEAQNTTPEQMKTFITRMGEGSRIVILGDEKQSDIGIRKSGLSDIHEKVRDIGGVKVVDFLNKDVVRHFMVQKILDRYDDCEFLEQKTREAEKNG